MSVQMNFDASLWQEDSGACFEIVARDQAHGRLIAAWLRKVCAATGPRPDCQILARQILEPQSVRIEV